MRRIVNVDIYNSQVNEYNKELAKDFLIEKKSQGKSENTLKQYKIDLRILSYLVWEHFDNKNFTDLTRKNIRDLFVIFQEMGMSSARANGLMSCLRSALEFCTEDDDYEYEYNVGSRVKGLQKEPVREITFLTDEQIQWLLTELEQQEEYLMAVYVALSCFSGKRKSEVYQVLKEGLGERFYTNKVRGKRGKKFRLYYNEQVQRLIRLYLEQRGEDDMPQLFVKLYRNGKKEYINKATFNYWCDIFSNMLNKRENKKIHVNPHCFRHSRLENLSRSGIPLEKLKTLANHSDISTTESYLANRDEEDIADIFGMPPECFK